MSTAICMLKTVMNEWAVFGYYFYEGCWDSKNVFKPSSAFSFTHLFMLYCTRWNMVKTIPGNSSKTWSDTLAHFLRP